MSYTTIIVVVLAALIATLLIQHVWAWWIARSFVRAMVSTANVRQLQALRDAVRKDHTRDDDASPR